MNNKYLFCIVGESGSGKTTLVNQLVKRYGFKSIDSYTTRPKRNDNEKGHTFVENFDEIRHDLAGYDPDYNGYEYGCTNKQIEENDLYVVNLKGIENLRKNYKGKKNILSIYISVPEETRILRMLKDQRSSEHISKRIKNDRIEFKDVFMQTDYAVKNINFEESIQTLYEYIMERIEDDSN
jgi:guanylate kinase